MHPPFSNKLLLLFFLILNFIILYLFVTALLPVSATQYAILLIETAVVILAILWAIYFNERAYEKITYEEKFIKPPAWEYWIYTILILAITIINITAFSPGKTGNNYYPTSGKDSVTLQDNEDSSYLLAIYKEAMKDVANPSQRIIDSNLVAITGSNKTLVRKKIGKETYILTVTFKGDTAYYPKSKPADYNTGKYETWVTASPELLNRARQIDLGKNPVLRLKQLLGLPPFYNYRYIVEFWVRPQDLFRPCPDSSAGDNVCELCYPKGVSSSYRLWVDNTRVSRLYCPALKDQFPWTQLGYTYDWNPGNKKHVGLSEFVIDMNKNVVVNRIYTVEQYLNQ